MSEHDGLFQQRSLHSLTYSLHCQHVQALSAFFGPHTALNMVNVSIVSLSRLDTITASCFLLLLLLVLAATVGRTDQPVALVLALGAEPGLQSQHTRI